MFRLLFRNSKTRLSNFRNKVLPCRIIRLNPKLSPFVAYTDPLTACLISLFVFSETLSPTQTLSMALLFGAVVIPERKSK